MHIYPVMIFSVPNQNSSSTLSSGQGTTKAPPSQNTTSDGIFDPGGEKCDPTPIEDELVITIQVMRYTTMALSAIFLVEVSFDRFDFPIFFFILYEVSHVLHEKSCRPRTARISIDVGSETSDGPFY